MPFMPESNHSLHTLVIIAALAVVLAGANLPAAAQSETAASKDPQGLAIAEQALAAHGGVPETVRRLRQ